MSKNRKPYSPLVVVIVLMAITSIALAFTVDVNLTDTAGVKVFFPDTVGAWTGAELRSCQSTDCRGQFPVDELDDLEVCPKCGDRLDAKTIGENNLLPDDTVLLRKRYQHPDGREIYASIVLSGTERVSIHRPQICLVGQGNEIIREHVLSVPLENRKPLKVMVLDIIKRIKSPDGRVLAKHDNYYGYWFVGKGRETHSHLMRMFWMASDRIFRNVAHRWAYIAISGSRDPDSETHYDEARDFVKELYPHMIIE